MIFVAECGSMHKGDPAIAYEMMRQAKRCGADVAKFQLGHVSTDRVRYIDLMAPQLAAWAKQLDIEFMASIFSFEGLEVARKIGQRRYKIPHQRADDEPLVQAVLSDGKETFVSSSRWADKLCVRNIYATHLYPTYPDQLEMPEDFLEYYGYSDHSHGIEPCLLAIARGAKYIEKHFCLDKTDLATRDTPFSATPDEFSDLVRIGRPLGSLVGG
jgi:sialic acid synthase SpsE